MARTLARMARTPGSHDSHGSHCDSHGSLARILVTLVSHEAESFAQRECDVITVRPIAQKTLRAFATVHRTPTRLGSVLLRRTQLLLLP